MNAVLFDLDGTLLPIDEEVFTKAYFRELSRWMQPEGFEPDQLVSAVWAGTKRMVRNDGARRNDEVFWDEFARCIPCDAARARRLCDAFYDSQFNNLRAVARPAPHAADVVRALKAKGYALALATNPVFPLVAVRSRLRWIGLEPGDFQWVTTYENSRFCKPSPDYYREILAAIGARPEECLMVGNNVSEDMCFARLGGQVYLVTDHVENPRGEPTDSYQQGSMGAFAAFARALPDLLP